MGMHVRIFTLLYVMFLYYHSSFSCESISFEFNCHFCMCLMAWHSEIWDRFRVLTEVDTFKTQQTLYDPSLNCDDCILTLDTEYYRYLEAKYGAMCPF